MSHFKAECELMPSCSEKFCLELILNLTDELNDGKKSNSINLEDCLQKIEQELQKENLWLDNYRNDFELIKANYYKRDLPISIERLNNFLNRKIRDLDFSEIINSIVFSINSLESKIKKEKIILILGITGAGKSTVLHYLAGSEMIKDENKCISPNLESIKNPDLTAVVSKLSMNSETRDVTPITINYFDQDEDENFKLIICDTPGFCDTNGPEIDISNSIILKTAIDLSLAIKPILLFSNNMGPRFQQLKEISNILVNMINNFKVIKHSMVYMFNRFDEIEPKKIKDMFLSIKKDAENGNDESLKILIDDLCERRVTEFLKLDLLDKNPERILKVLNNREYHYIEKPSKVFNVSYSSDSKYKLEKQIEKHFNSIETCIKTNSKFKLSKELNYKLAIYKVDELLKLAGILNSDELNRLIKSHSNRLIESTESCLREKVEVLFDKLANDKKIENESAFEYLKAVHQSIHIDPILNKFLPFEEQRDNLSKLTSELKKRLDELKNLIKKYSKNIDENFNLVKFNFSRLKFFVNFKANFERNNKVLTNLSDYLTNIYEETCNSLFKSIKTYIDQNSDHIIKTKNINKIVQDLENISKFKDLDEKNELKSLYDEVQEKLKKEFELNSHEAKNLLFPENEILFEQDEEKINEIYEKLNSIDLYFNLALNNKRLGCHVEIETIKEYYKNFIETIVNFFTNIKKEFDEKIQINGYQNVQKDILIIFIFKKNYNFDRNICLIYKDLVEKLVEIINAFKSECVNSLNKLLEAKTQSESRSMLSTIITDSLEKLFDFKWLEIYKRYYISNSIRFIEEKIESHLKKLMFETNDLNVNLTEFSDLKDLNLMIIKLVFLDEIFESSINESKGMESNIQQKQYRLSSSLHNTIKDRKANLIEKLKSLLLEIKNWNFDNCDYNNLEKSILFLEACESTLNQKTLLLNDVNETKRFILSILNKRFDSLKKTVDEFFEIDKLTVATPNEIIKITNKIDSVYKAIEECVTIVSEYKKCANIVNAGEYIKICFEYLSTFYSSIEDNLSSFFKHPAEYKDEINVFLNLCKESKKFDKINRKQKLLYNFSIQSFNELLTQFSNELRNDTNSRYEKCLNLIKNDMYLNLKKNLNNFKDDERNLKNLKKKLNEHLVNHLQNNCLEKLEKYLSQLDESNLLELENELKNNFNKFNNAKIFLKQFIYLENDSDELPKIEEKIKRKYTAYMNNLEYQINLSQNRFEIIQMDRKKKTLERTKFISFFLNDKSFVENLNNDLSNNNSISLNDQVFSNTKTLEDLESLNDINENYESLRKMPHLRELKKIFESRVRNIFEKELELAVNKSNNFETLNSNEHFKKCQKIAEKSLPIKIKEDFIDDLLETSKAKIESNLLKDKLTKESNSIINVSQTYTINSDKYIEQLKELNVKKDYENIEIIVNIILEVSKKLLHNFQIDLNNDVNHRNLINTNFKLEFYENIYKKFSIYISELNFILQKQYAPKINDLFDKCYEIIETSINKTSFEFQVVKDNFDFLISFYEYSTSNPKLQECLNIGIIQSKLRKLFETRIDLVNNYNPEEIDLNSLDDLKYYFKLSNTIYDLKIIQKLALTKSIKTDYLKNLIETKLSKLLNEVLPLNLIDDCRGKQLSDYEKFFDQFFKKLNHVFKVYNCFKEFNLNSLIKSQFEECMKKINSEMSDVYSNGKEYLNNMLTSKQEIIKIDQDLSNKFQNCFNNLKSFKTKSSSFLFDSGINLSSPNFEEEYRNKIMKQCENYLIGIESKNLKESSISFSNLKEIGLNISFFKTSIDKKLQESIISWIKSNGGFKKVGDLSLELLRLENGQIILDEHSDVFGSYERSLFYKKISDRDINKVMEELIEKNGPEKINKQEFLDFHKNHETTFKDLIKRYKLIDPRTGTINLTSIKLNISKIVNDNNIDGSGDKNRLEHVKNMASLTANLFALWALIIRSEELKSLGTSSDSESNDDNCLFQPHPAQVLSIAMMLNIGHKGNKHTKGLNNCLIQIGTGEGKSVTLSITAVILALFGYNVFCVCYSKYLSKRDFDSFYLLFQMLGLTTNIKYDSFYGICEQMINKHGDLRVISDLFINKAEIEINIDEDFQKRPKILLIDEVDVFFSEDFYGNYYLAALNLRKNCISNILDFIWQTYKNDKTKLSFNFIIKSKEYNECIVVFKDWIQLIDSSILMILSDIKTFEALDHKVQDDRIGYAENHAISFDIEYGYKTIFAYYLYESRGKISKESLNKNKSFLVKLGKFSLSEIPKTEFKYILGVTGTLDALINTNKIQKVIIEYDYNIKTKIIMPSVYGNSKFVFNSKSEIYIENEENYHDKLVDEIKKYIDSQRAVFVFFENSIELNKFKNSDKYVYQLQTEVLTEETKDDEKKRLIQFAAASNKITLITKAFGRGTDFKVRDKKVKEEGLHVIQAFLSNEKSEEIQIKGRTARQGEKGTFSMVIYLKDLEKYNFFARDLEKLDKNEYYTTLDSLRNKYFENSFRDTHNRVKNIKAKHDESVQLLKYLVEKKKKLVIDHLINLNNYSKNYLNSNKKILILIDATGSMQNLLEKTKKTIEVMFVKVFEILRIKNVDKSFEIKITLYRNYNSEIDEILQNSSWERTAENLVQFLNSIQAKGGFVDQTNEAIELGLWQANKEDDLSEVILLGDAPANTYEQIRKKRNLYEEKLSKSEFSNETETFRELEILNKKTIKVNAFYLHKSAKDNFEKIAKVTGGKAGFLDINSDNSSKLLIDLFCEQILTSFGDETLLEAYRTHKFDFN